VKEISSLIKRGDFSAAESLCRQQLERQPGDIPAHFFLAFILWRRNQPETALKYCRQTLALNPDNAGLLSDLGNILRELGAYTEALAALDQSLQLRPDHSGTRYNRALVLDALGREQEALPLIDSIGPEEPLFQKARYLRGTIRQGFGDMTGAEADYLTCIEADAGDYGAWYALVSTRRFEPGEAIFSDLKKQLAENSGDNSARQHYLFALAKIHDDAGDYETATDYLLEANRLVNARYDKQKIEKRLQQLCSHFPAARPQKDLASTRMQPVFIVGLPRSGSTLVETLLDRHPDIMALGELEILPRLISDFSRPPDFQEMADLGTRYLDELPDKASQSALVLDKMPENFWRLGYIQAMFPGARIIHCLRDVRDVAISNFFKLYTKGNSFAYSLDSLAHYTACHQAIMKHWLSLMPDRILQLDYASLVGDPDRSIREIMAFLGLDWHEAVPETAPQDKRRIRTASNWQVRQKIYTTAIDRWKRYPRLEKEFTAYYRSFSEARA